MTLLIKEKLNILITVFLFSFSLNADVLDKKSGTEVWDEPVEPYKKNYDPKDKALFDHEMLKFNEEQRYFANLKSDWKKTIGRGKVLRHYGWRRAMPSGSVFIDNELRTTKKKSRLEFSSVRNKPSNATKNKEDDIFLDFSASPKSQKKSSLAKPPKNKKNPPKKQKRKEAPITAKEEKSFEKEMSEDFDLEKELDLDGLDLD